MITFRSVGENSKRTKKVSQRIGEQVVQSFARNENIVINGEWFNVSDIESVRKINVDNFGKEYAEQQQRAELANPEEKAYLDSLPQLSDGHQS